MFFFSLLLIFVIFLYIFYFWLINFFLFIPIYFYSACSCPASAHAMPIALPLLLPMPGGFKCLLSLNSAQDARAASTALSFCTLLLARASSLHCRSLCYYESHFTFYSFAFLGRKFQFTLGARIHRARKRGKNVNWKMLICNLFGLQRG